MTRIDAALLATGDRSQFDTIVVGIRASEARPDFVANRRRLIDFMERGGTMIVQYEQSDYAARNLPPYPAQLPGDLRVTDETARVRILPPQHPRFMFPNRITEADFDGWVQEHNLYAFGSLDSRYVPLLESADPGEPRSAAVKCTRRSAKVVTSTPRTRGSDSCRPACPARIVWSPIS